MGAQGELGWIKRQLSTQKREIFYLEKTQYLIVIQIGIQNKKWNALV